MNKHQEALNRLVEGNYLTNREKKQFANILQELVDKETPKRPARKLGNWGNCLHCNQQVFNGWDYCPYCGQKLDWSE